MARTLILEMLKQKGITHGTTWRREAESAGIWRANENKGVDTKMLYEAEYSVDTMIKDGTTSKRHSWSKWRRLEEPSHVSIFDGEG